MNPPRPEVATSICGYPPRLFAYALALVLAALPLIGGAIWGVISSPPELGAAVGVAVFLALTVLAELKPIPLDEGGTRLVSLAFVFVVSSQILFGWEFGVLIGAIALTTAQLAARTPLLRTMFNTAVYAIAAFAASVPWFLFAGDDAVGAHHLGFLTGLSFVEGAIFVGLNVALVCVAIALFEGVRARSVIIDHLRHSGPAFAIMAFIAALAVALWTVWPPLLVLLAGPLFALTLFQRYALRSRVALHAASTDSLTRLKNHRSYELDIDAAFAHHAESASPVTLCLLDIDDFKLLNDRFGHPVGDRMLVAFAEAVSSLRCSEAYRLGGDEFALIVDGGEDAAVEAIATLQAAVAKIDIPERARMTFSAGIACHPASAGDREELMRVADVALYWTKRHGKNRWCVYSPSVVELSWPAELAATVEYDARLRAVGNLIRVVDARDTYTGSHSQSVAVLAEGIGRELGLSEGDVTQVRLAALLHDLGKIAIPDDILQRPGRVEGEDLLTLRRHPEIGHQLLQGLDVHPVDEWILHHHEHWNGSGYPYGLKGEKIPIGSRIILVADAFDAMTTERCYRNAMAVGEALVELRQQSGTQFDPSVVDALERSLALVESAVA